MPHNRYRSTQQRKRNKQIQKELSTAAAERRAKRAEAHAERMADQKRGAELRKERKRLEEQNERLKQEIRDQTRARYEIQEQRFSDFQFEEWHRGVAHWVTAALGTVMPDTFERRSETEAGRKEDPLTEEELDRFRAFVCYYLYRRMEAPHTDERIPLGLRFYCDRQDLQSCQKKMASGLREVAYYYKQRRVIPEDEQKELELLVASTGRVEIMISAWCFRTGYLDREEFKIPQSLTPAARLNKLLHKISGELAQHGYELMRALMDGNNVKLARLCEEGYVADTRLGGIYQGMKVALDKKDATQLHGIIHWDRASLAPVASELLDQYLRHFEDENLDDCDAMQTIRSNVPRRDLYGQTTIDPDSEAYRHAVLGTDVLSTKLWHEFMGMERKEIIVRLRELRAQYTLAERVKNDPQGWIQERRHQFAEASCILARHKYKV